MHLSNPFPALCADAIKLSHYGIYVQNLESMAGYYQQVLDFRQTDHGLLGNTEIIFLSRDPNEHHQIILASGRPENLGFNLIAFMKLTLASSCLPIAKNIIPKLLQ